MDTPMVFMTTDMDGSTTTAASILPPLPRNTSTTPAPSKSNAPGKAANEKSKKAVTGAKAPVVASVDSKEEKKQTIVPPSKADEKKEKAASSHVHLKLDAVTRFGPIFEIRCARTQAVIETVRASNVIAKSFVDMPVGNRAKIARRIIASWSLHGREIYVGGPLMFMAACVHATAGKAASCIVCSQSAPVGAVPLVMHPSEVVDEVAYRKIVDFLGNAELTPIHGASYTAFITELFAIYPVSGPVDSRPELVAHRIMRAIGLDDKGVPCLVGLAPATATSSRSRYQVYRLCTEWQIMKLVYTLHVLECCSTSRPSTLAALKKMNKNKEETKTIAQQYSKGANVYVKERVPKDADHTETTKAKTVITGPLFAYAASTYARSQTTERPSVDNMMIALKAFEDLCLIGFEGTVAHGQSAYWFESTPASFGVFNKVGDHNEWNGKAYRLISVYAVLSNNLLEDDKDTEPFSFVIDDDAHAAARVKMATAAAAVATVTDPAVRDADPSKRSPKRMRTSVTTTPPLIRKSAVAPSSPTIDLTESQPADEDMDSTSSRGPSILPAAAVVPNVVTVVPTEDDLVVDD